MAVPRFNSTAGLDANNKVIINPATPVSDTDLATKGYIDTLLSTIDFGVASWDGGVRLTASGGEDGDHFGWSSSLSGDGNTLAVGARADDTSMGSVYIYNWVGYWFESAKIQASDRQSGDIFGESVSISGDGKTMVVGAKGEDTGSNNAGAIYIFNKLNDVWTETVKLQSSVATSFSAFGSAVSISGNGDVIVVGVPEDDAATTDAGAVCIFTLSNGIWTETLRSIAPDPIAYGKFGFSVAIAGNGRTALVGAPYTTFNGTKRGTVYIYELSGATWTHTGYIDPPVINANAAFGHAVSISADGLTAIIGSPYDVVGSEQSGAAHIFTRSGNTWTALAKLVSSRNFFEDRFGQRVAISGDGKSAIVASPLEDISGPDVGATYMFSNSTGLWVETALVQSSDKEVYAEYGESVCISGDGTTAATCSVYVSNARGSAHVYKFR